MASEVSTENQQPITVFGEGTASAVPDMLVLTVGLENYGADAAQALSGTNSSVMRMVKMLVEKGVRPTDIDNTWIGIYPLVPSSVQLGQSRESGHDTRPDLAWSDQRANPDLNAYARNLYGAALGTAAQAADTGILPQNIQTARPGPGVQLPNRFVSGAWLRIAVREPNRAGEILDATCAAGAAYCSGQSLRLQDDSAVRRRALEAAAKDARSKAESVAVALGRQLRGAVAFVEESVLQGSGSNADGHSGPVNGAATGLNVNGFTTASGEIHFTSRVRVTFELA